MAVRFRATQLTARHTACCPALLSSRRATAYRTPHRSSVAVRSAAEDDSANEGVAEVLKLRKALITEGFSEAQAEVLATSFVPIFTLKRGFEDIKSEIRNEREKLQLWILAAAAFTVLLNGEGVVGKVISNLFRWK